MSTLVPGKKALLLMVSLCLVLSYLLLYWFIEYSCLRQTTLHKWGGEDGGCFAVLLGCKIVLDFLLTCLLWVSAKSQQQHPKGRAGGSEFILPT